MFSLRTILLSGTLVCFLLLIPVSVSGQNLSTPTSDAVGISTESQYIEPKEQVTVTAESRLINLNNAEITWQVNGSVVNTGVGLTEIDVQSGNVGEVTQVSFRANVPNHGIITRSLEIRPVDVDLVWESTESFVPAFYKGKPLHSGWGNVKVTVIPHIYRPESESQYTADELVYEWSYNNLVYGDDSGRGENTFTIDGTPRQNRVEVLIQTPSGDNIASESITVPAVDPQLLIYPSTLLRGTVLSQEISTNEEISNIQINNETVLQAEPYYFLADKSIDEKLGYEWAINGESVATNTRNSLPLESLTSSSRNNISLEVADESHLLFPNTQTSFEVAF